MSPLPADAGYSGQPLAQKLGLKDGQRVLFLDLPDHLADLAQARTFAAVERGGWSALETAQELDYVHGFAVARGVLEDHARALEKSIQRAGMVWISWPKKASKVPTDITEDTIREVLLPTGLVDVKVVAVDNVWSGLRFSIRKNLR